jgi:hypothetical protein
VRYGARDEITTAEFTFENFDDGDPVSGRGWASLGTACRLEGYREFAPFADRASSGRSRPPDQRARCLHGGALHRAFPRLTEPTHPAAQDRLVHAEFLRHPCYGKAARRDALHRLLLKRIRKMPALLHLYRTLLSWLESPSWVSCLHNRGRITPSLSLERQRVIAGYHRHLWPVRLLCAVLGISTSGYYAGADVRRAGGMSRTGPFSRRSVASTRKIRDRPCSSRFKRVRSSVFVR